jgi:glycosyltransferase involved in cell wall biosynthesis
MVERLSSVPHKQPSALRTTVVVPAWGEPYVSDYLGEALDSIVGQDWQGRVLVVDNCAAEAVPERPGVDVLRSPRRLSLGGARNLGLDSVRTPYVMFWDGDDVMLPGTLTRLEQLLDSHPRAVAASAAILERPGVPHHWPRAASGALAARRPRAFALAHLVISQFPTTGCVLLRTDAVRDAGGFPDTEAGGDWVLGSGLALRGEIVFDPRPGRLYRQHARSISAGRTLADRLRNAGEVRARLRADRGAPSGLRRAAALLALPQLVVILAVGPLARLVRARTLRP